MRRLGKRRRLPFSIRKYVAPIIGGSIALFSLLLTLQLIWRSFENLSSHISAPALWLAVEGLDDGSNSLLPNRQTLQHLETHDQTVKVRLIAPPDRRISLTRNGFPIVVRPFATGKSTTDVRLRKGTNIIGATLEPDGASRSSEPAVLEIVYHPVPTATPWLLGAWARQSDSLTWVSVFGFGEPESIVHVSLDPSRSIKTDRLGAFRGEFWVPSKAPELDLEVSAPNSGASYVGTPHKMTVDTTKADIQFADPKRTLGRQLRIDIDAHRYKLTASANIPLEAEVYPYELDAGQFLRDVFGLCIQSRDADAELSSFDCWGSVGDKVRFSPTRSDKTTIIVELDRPIFSNLITFVYEPRSELAGSFLSLPDDSLRVEATPDAPFRPVAAGSRKDGSALVWTGGAISENPLHSNRLDFGNLLVIGTEESQNSVTAGAASSVATDDDQSNALEEPPERIIDRIRMLERIVPDKVRALIQTLLTAIPFLWFLWILSRYPPASRVHAATLQAVVLTFLTLHLTIVALLLFQVSFSPTPLAFLHDLAPGTALTKVAEVLQSASYIYPFLAIGVVLLVNPVFRAFRREALNPQLHTRARFLRAMVWIVFWIGVFAVPIAAVWARIRIDNAQDIFGRLPMLSLLLGGGVAVIWFVLFWSLRGIFRIRIGVRDALRANWAMLLLPLVPPVADVVNNILRNFIATRAQIYPFMLPEGTGPQVSAAIVAILGALLLLHTGELSLRLTQHPGTWRWYRSQNRLLLLLPLLIISIPVVRQGQTSISTFIGFFYLMDWLLPYALLIGGVLLVRLLNRNDSFQLTKGEIQLGALLFAWYVSGHNATLLFIPVPFLVAWYVFNRWLLVCPAEEKSSSPSILSKLLDERRAQARSDDVEKGLDKKLSNGELKLSEYWARLQEVHDQERLASAWVVIESGGTSPRVLSKGPENGPLANARIAVLYGLLISAPFQAITLYGFVQRTYTNFPLAEFTYALVYSITAWVLMAAVFGYFYHRIRGRNGFEKALCFSLAVVLPTLPLHLIAGESVVNPAQLLDVVQVVAFVLVLALVAFDLRTLSKQRRDWRDLLTLYGFASAAYGSTIVLAIASSLASNELLPKLWAALGWLTGHAAN